MSEPLVQTPGTLRPLLRLATPVLIEQMLGILVWFSDRLLVGHYFPIAHQAAITLMAYLLWLIYGLFSTVGIGATAMVARYVGAGNYKMARHVTEQAFILGAIVAVMVTGLGALFAERMVYFFQLEGPAADHAVVYFRYMLPVIPLIMIESVGIACLRGAGDMVAGLVIMFIVNVVNVAVSWALVLGLGPLPALGWDGIAIGTMCGLIVGAMLVTVLMLRGRRGLRVQPHMLRFNSKLIRRLLWTGVPGGADMLSIIGCQLWFVAIINSLGILESAAHGVAVCVESVAFLPGVAFQVATATLVGQYLGAENPRKAGHAAWTAVSVGGGVMAFVGLLIYTTAPWVAPLFVEQEEVAALAVPLLRTVSLAMPALALTLILSGAMRGAGDTRWTMAISVIGLLGVRIPLALYLANHAVRVPGIDHIIGIESPYVIGIVGAWCAMVVDLHLRALLITTRIFQGGWKKVKV